MLVVIEVAEPETEVEAQGKPWRPETNKLPPAFAPRMPVGVEELRFAPGMFTVGAPDYWSYVFVLRLRDKFAGTDRLTKLIEHYYVGLISTVAANRERDLTRAPAKVSLEALGKNRYRAKIDLIDVFVTGKPVLLNLDLSLVDRNDGTYVLVAASPQPRTHAIWRSMAHLLKKLAAK